MYKTLRKRKREEIELKQRRCKHLVTCFQRDPSSSDSTQYIEVCTECRKTLGKKTFKTVKGW